jgi:four helix bundle protein
MKVEGRKPAPDICGRSLDYGVRAVRLFRALQEQPDRAGWTVGRQYLRSATSIGANVAEAQSAETRADFVHKYGIALTEARESLYWLRLMDRSGLLPSHRVGPLIGETEELTAVITAITVRAKQNAEEKRGPSK